jgi:hypothetical protein
MAWLAFPVGEPGRLADWGSAEFATNNPATIAETKQRVIVLKTYMEAAFMTSLSHDLNLLW